MKKLSTFPDEEKIHNTRMYHEYHDLGMKDGWLPGNQQDNFRMMSKLSKFAGIPLKNANCLDIGCGSGDLSYFLRTLGINTYLGIDIYAISLEKAQAKYPHERFKNLDILSETINETFNYVFCSGALTVKFKTINNYDFLFSMVKTMWELCGVGMVFNVLTDDDKTPDPDLFFYNVKQVEKICREIIGINNNLLIKKTPRICQIHVYLWR